MLKRPDLHVLDNHELRMYHHLVGQTVVAQEESLQHSQRHLSLVEEEMARREIG